MLIHTASPTRSSEMSKQGCGKEFVIETISSPEIEMPEEMPEVHIKIMVTCSRRLPCPECAAAYKVLRDAVKEWFHQIETDVSDVYAAAIKELEVHSALRAIEHRKGDG